MTQTLKGKSMVHKNNYCRDSKRISIGGRARLIKCRNNGVNRLGLISIPVIKSQNGFY